MRRNIRGVRHLPHPRRHAHFPRAKKPILILTGYRQHHRLLVMVQGTKVWLSGSLFSTLCDLVSARVRTGTGYIRLARHTVSRLRTAIDAATGKRGLGATLILSGPGEEYRLASQPREVAFDPTFRELSAPRHLAADVLQHVLQQCRELTRSSK